MHLVGPHVPLLVLSLYASLLHLLQCVLPECLPVNKSVIIYGNYHSHVEVYTREIYGISKTWVHAFPLDQVSDGVDFSKTSSLENQWHVLVLQIIIILLM